MRSVFECGISAAADRSLSEEWGRLARATDGTAWIEVNANAGSILIARTTPAMRYRATRRYLADPRDTGTPNGTVQLLAAGISR